MSSGWISSDAGVVVVGCGQATWPCQVQLFWRTAKERSNPHSFPRFNSCHFKQSCCLNCDCEHLPAESHQRCATITPLGSLWELLVLTTKGISEPGLVNSAWLQICVPLLHQTMEPASVLLPKLLSGIRLVVPVSVLLCCFSITWMHNAKEFVD